MQQKLQVNFVFLRRPRTVVIRCRVVCRNRYVAALKHIRSGLETVNKNVLTSASTYVVFFSFFHKATCIVGQDYSHAALVPGKSPE